MAEDRVLVTGGAGFIGRALVQRCLDDGHRVAVLDDFSAGSRHHLDPFRGQIDVYELDVLDRTGVDDVIASARPSAVFHLAALHYIPDCNAHPDRTLRVNVEGTHTVFDAAARNGVQVAVLASSGAFYPSRDDPLGEELAAAPVDVYGLSKQLAEEVGRYMARTTPLRIVAARLFNTYGPYETNPHLIPHIVDSLRQGSTVPLGNVDTRRDYVHVDDVARLLLRCASPRDDQPFTVVNIGTGEEHSARDIVGLLSEILDRRLEIDIDPQRVRPVDKLHQRADTRRLEELTGSTATIPLRAGLERLARHERL